MHFKNYFLFLLLLISTVLYSQRETSNWFFGNKVWLNFKDNPSIKTGSKMIGIENCSSISDSNGNLILYSNGGSIYGANHDTIFNGTGIFGNESSSMGSVFSKCPHHDSLFYLFTTDFQGNNKGFCYSVIDLSGGYAKVTRKNIQLVNYTLEPINITKHANGIDYWIIVHSKVGNSFYSFLLTKDGVLDCPIVTDIGDSFSGDPIECQSKANFSPNGNFYTLSNLTQYKCFIFRFDNTNGQFSDFSEVGDFSVPNGMIFSKNNKYLYIAERGLNIYQYEISNKNIQSIFLNKTSADLIAGLQFGIDNKIYVNYMNDSFLGVISNIDSIYPKAKYKRKGFDLGAADSRYGLPNFNQSYFYTPAIDFKYELDCINNTVQFWGYDTFNARVHQWEIRNMKGDNWQTIGQDKNIVYTFTDTGMYEVRYGAAINSRQDTVSKTIHIYPKINKHFLGKDTVYAKGTPFKKQLSAPYGMHCQLWQDSSSLSTYQADTAGRYTCKVTNQSFCEVTDTIDIKECINTFTVPSIFRIKDSLYTYQQVADSFIWFKNNVQFKITKAPVIRLTDTGTYRVEAAKKDHCNRSSANFRIEKLSLHKLNSQSIGIKIYPNPANEKVFIEANSDFSLLVKDATGKTILEAENIKEITLANGIYYFRLTVNNTSYFEKVVILN